MFDNYVLNEVGQAEVKKFKVLLSSTARELLEMMPEGREKSLFKTKIEESIFYGTRAIASKDANYNEIFEY